MSEYVRYGTIMGPKIYFWLETHSTLKNRHIRIRTRVCYVVEPVAAVVWDFLEVLLFLLDEETKATYSSCLSQIYHSVDPPAGPNRDWKPELILAVVPKRDI